MRAWTKCWQALMSNRSMKQYKVHILQTSADDLIGLIWYVGEFSPSGAAILADAIRQGIDSMETMSR